MASLRRWWRLGRWGRLGQLRRSLQLLASIDARLAEQNTYLQRLADEFAPVPPVPAARPDPAAPRTLDEVVATEVTYTDPREVAAVEHWTGQFAQTHGRTPTDDELLSFLAERAERAFIQQHAGDR